MFQTRPTALLIALLGTLGFSSAGQGAEPEFKVRPGDHICYVGNTLADRMQHHGWLESLIQLRFPKHKLVFRNLGFSADELTVRPRSLNFGSPDDHLKRSAADVIFAFFGYNESFAGEQGLPAFRQNLIKFIDETRSKKYNGESAPRIVLFAPIAHEHLNHRLLPDGSESNHRLALYSQAMSEVAAEKQVAFVDLFNASRELYSQSKRPLTLNGIHLRSEGNSRLAEVIDKALFGESPARNRETIAKMRAAVLDKNLHWHNRYRATDGYSVFGGRSTLRFVKGQTNFVVMQRELEMLDVMTANRDKRIWAVASGTDLKVDDSNTPPPIPVESNRKGRLKDGRHEFLQGEAAIDKMTLAKGMRINLFASEETFPELVNPVQSAVDADGRLWVAAWPSYPHWNPKKELSDKLLILPDENGDGKADRCIVFADGLHNPTGFEFWGGGVLVAQAPDILFLKDTDGDDKADVRLRVMHGIDSADTHHTANSFIIGPGGWLYFQRGVFHVTNYESPWGKPFRGGSTGMYRWDPRTWRFEKHFNMGPNPHGDVFDRWGNQFASDGTSGNGFYIGFPGRGAPKTLYQKRVRPVPAIGILSSDHFPPENQGNLLICNVIGFQGIAQYRFVNQGAGYHCEELDTPLLSSSDPNFRPSDLEIGGDGALYVLDWQNPLIGHMQHNIRDPNRDALHGRVYRMTAEGRPLMKPVKMRGRPIDEILSHLTSETLGVRYRAKLELSGRDSRQVVAAAAKWSERFDPAEAEDAQPLVEALWLHQQHRFPNPALLKKVLQSVEPNARAAATRVMRDWANDMDDARSLLSRLAADKDPRVRAEAVVAATYYQGGDAAEAIFEADRWPQDQQLSFVLNEAKKSIDVGRYIENARSAGRKLSLAGQAYVLKNASVNDLLKLERTEAVYVAILSRGKVPQKHVRDALGGLAKLRKVSQFRLLLDLIEEKDGKSQANSLAGLSDVLLNQPTEQLNRVEERLRKLARSAKSSEARQLGYAGWITATGSPDDAFLSALNDKHALQDMLESVALITNEKIRASLFERVMGLASELPAGLSERGGSSLGQPGVLVDYFEPNPKNVAIETLERLKPVASGVVPDIRMNVPQLKRRDAFALRFTGSLHIERAGKHTFFTRSDDGSRLYIGGELVVNNDGLHGPVEKSGTIELSAGSHPIVVTYFDNGGGDGLSVSYSGPGIKGKSALPPTRLSVAAADTLHDVAIRALRHVPGHETEKFTRLSALVKAGRNRTSAIGAIRRIPEKSWPAKEIGALVDNLVAYTSEIPARYRTGAAAMDAIGLAKSLANKLPAERREGILNRLNNLDVRVIAIGTVPHRMIFDKERIAVQAGRPVEFRFSNTDNMPHNFAIAQPGALEEIGLLGEATARYPDVELRGYIPKSDKILLASRLLQPGRSQAIAFDAPKQPGIYPYVCTYPGHWRRMYGALYVVADLAEYEADPQAYLAKAKLPLQNELLKFNTRGREWKFAELAGFVKPLPAGRNFDVGKQLFKAATCVACHKLNDEGRVFGPDLAKLDPKKTAEDVLRSLLEPSHKIEEKYQTHQFELESGQIVSGMIVEDTGDALKLIENPLAKTKPLVIRKDSIEDRVKSTKSIMPEGLANKLTREEILDLVAYVFAGGDKKHKLFEMHKH